MRCKKCGFDMKEAGFPYHNRRFICNSCNLIFVPFLERYFGSNFLGIKWGTMK